VCCLESDELQFLNTLSANKVAILCSVGLLYYVLKLCNWNYSGGRGPQILPSTTTASGRHVGHPWSKASFYTSGSPWSSKNAVGTRQYIQHSANPLRSLYIVIHIGRDKQTRLLELWLPLDCSCSSRVLRFGTNGNYNTTGEGTTYMENRGP